MIDYKTPYRKQTYPQIRVFMPTVLLATEKNVSGHNPEPSWLQDFNAADLGVLIRTVRGGFNVNDNVSFRVGLDAGKFPNDGFVHAASGGKNQNVKLTGVLRKRIARAMTSLSAQKNK